MFLRRHWIPPLGLAFGQLNHGFSWGLALWIAARPGAGYPTLPQLAWVHVVALGWITVTALSILLHAIPAFANVRWRYERVARYALFSFAITIVAFVIAFLAAPPMLVKAAALVALTLTIYLTTAWSTLWQAFRSEDRVDRAVSRAFAGTLLILFIAVLLGVGSSWNFADASAPPWVAHLPAAHANLAIFGWLTLLIYGVSARTLRPITGNASRRPVLHVVAGTTTLLGALLLAIGVAVDAAWLSWLGGGLIGIGAAAYIVDVAVVLSGSTVEHRLPQAFVGAGLAWLIAALVAGAGVLAGRPWEAAFGFLMLAGWVGQLVNAHIFHIGVRLIATIYRGDDDETPPSELLDPRWSWFAYFAMQLAVGSMAIGLLWASTSAETFGAAMGLAGWLSLMTALVRARTSAKWGLASLS
jgi:hypothetical protein